MKPPDTVNGSGFGGKRFKRMNKPQSSDNLMTVPDYAKTVLNRRGTPVSPSYIWRLIRQHKNEGKAIDFEYREIGKAIWIVRTN